MVWVFGSAAIPPGPPPTGMVAVTATQPLAPWATPRASGAEAAAAVAIGTRPVMATAVKHAARQVNRTISCLLARYRQSRTTEPSGRPRACLATPVRLHISHDEHSDGLHQRPRPKVPVQLGTVQRSPGATPELCAA